jgi:hypothetical protein
VSQRVASFSCKPGPESNRLRRPFQAQFNLNDQLFSWLRGLAKYLQERAHAAKLMRVAWLSPIIEESRVDMRPKPLHSASIYFRGMCRLSKCVAVLASFAVLVILVTPAPDELPCFPRHIHCFVLILVSNSLLSLFEAILLRLQKPSCLLPVSGRTDLLAFTCTRLC